MAAQTGEEAPPAQVPCGHTTHGGRRRPSSDHPLFFVYLFIAADRWYAWNEMNIIFFFSFFCLFQILQIGREMTQGTKLPLPHTLVHTLRGHQGTVTTVRFNSACFYSVIYFKLSHTTEKLTIISSPVIHYIYTNYSILVFFSLRFFRKLNKNLAVCQAMATTA